MQNNPETYLVGADRQPVARNIYFLGSIKWLGNRPFDRHDYESLVRDMLAVPGAGPRTPLVAVSRSGLTNGLPLAAHWGPEDLIRAGSTEPGEVLRRYLNTHLNNGSPV